MLLLTHIIIALGGLAVATVGLFVPSNRVLHIAHTLTGLTIGTGTALIILKPGHLLSGCISSLSYLVIMLGLATVIKWRLATQKAE